MGNYSIEYSKNSYEQNVSIFKSGDGGIPILVLNEREFEKLFNEFKKQQKEWVKR